MRFVGALLLTGLLFAGCGGGTSPPTVDSTVSSTLPVTVPPGPPSQSIQDATRDGVLPELAALPADIRIEQLPDGFGTTRLETNEGTWLISQPTNRIPGLPGGCIIGDAIGLYGLDFLCTTDYAEILLLDSVSGEIVRAYPFATAHPQVLALTDDAVYCIRQGDGGVPDSMLCRIDRATFDAVVRVFPSAVDSAVGEGTRIFIPPNWTIEDPSDLVLWQRLTIEETRLTIEGISGSAKVDPITLELLEINT